MTLGDEMDAWLVASCVEIAPGCPVLGIYIARNRFDFLLAQDPQNAEIDCLNEFD